MTYSNYMNASDEALLRTTTSIGEDFVKALELLAKTDAPVGDYKPIKRYVDQMKAQAELTGYIGKKRGK